MTPLYLFFGIALGIPVFYIIFRFLTEAVLSDYWE